MPKCSQTINPLMSSVRSTGCAKIFTDTVFKTIKSKSAGSNKKKNILFCHFTAEVGLRTISSL